MFNNIDTILFDLDDTLVNTRALFAKQVNEALSVLSKHTNLSTKTLWQLYREAALVAYKRASINPDKKFVIIMDEFRKHMDLSEEIEDNIVEIFSAVYRTAPEIYPNVQDILNRVRKLGLTVALVTHAKKDWTDQKLGEYDLHKYFDYIQLVDVDEYKSAHHWQEALDNTNSDPSRTALVGDNLKGDIIAGHTVGIKHLFWIQYEDAWSVYKEGNLPEGANILSSIGDLVKHLN